MHIDPCKDDRSIPKEVVVGQVRLASWYQKVAQLKGIRVAHGNRILASRVLVLIPALCFNPGGGVVEYCGGRQNVLS